MWERPVTKAKDLGAKNKKVDTSYFARERKTRVAGDLGQIEEDLELTRRQCGSVTARRLPTGLRVSQLNEISVRQGRGSGKRHAEQIILAGTSTARIHLPAGGRRLSPQQRAKTKDNLGLRPRFQSAADRKSVVPKVARQNDRGRK